MGEQKTPSDTDRIAKLEHLVAEQARTIARMQRLGGFTDAKTLGVRCARIEKRVELLELDGEMLDGGMESCDDYVAKNGLHYRW